MRATNVLEALAGTTLRFTYVNSGVTPSQIYSRLLDRTDVMVNCMTAVSSGNGLYYAPMTVPGSRQWVVNEWVSWINSYPYFDRQLIRVVTLEVD